MRRLTRGTIREARNILTLTRARTSGSGSVGAAIPQPTAQNEMLIADATPAWSLLAAPTAQYQVPIAGAAPYTPAWAALTVEAISDLAYAVPALTLSTVNVEGAAGTVIRSDATILVFDATAPNTIEPDDAAAAGSASVAARRDHEHAVVCAAPASPSVNLAASAEGTGTSFARADHAHQLDQAIAPTWTALHTFAAHVAMSAATSYIRMDTSDGSDSKRIALCGGGGFADTRGGTIWLGGNEYTGGEGEINLVAGNVTGGDIVLWTASAQRVKITGPGIITLTAADNVGSALSIRDAGGIEYMRTVSTDAQPAVVFNEGGVDIDHRWEAVGQANALFIQGSTGNIGGKTNAPAADIHIVGGTVTNKHLANASYRIQILEDLNPSLQFIGEDTSTGMAHIILTAAPASGDNKHWIISHLGVDASNRFSVGYKTSSADGFTPYDPTEYFVILTDGKAGFGTSTPGSTGTVKLEIRGTDGNIAGPHVQLVTTGDVYPLLRFVGWTHDNISIDFDTYYDGVLKSSDAGSNARIQKLGDELLFKYDSGVAQGSTITWNNGIVLDLASGVVKIPNLAGVGNRAVIAAADGTLSAP